MKVALIIVAAMAVVCMAQDTPKPTPSDWFECPDDGTYGNPYNCHKYFVCISDNAWEFQCPSHLYFNAAKKICDTKSNAHCTPTTTVGYRN